MNSEKQKLTLELLIKEAGQFCISMSQMRHEDIVGVTDGKATGTYIEHEFDERDFSNFQDFLSRKLAYA